LADYYNTNYDAALQTFQRVTQLRPDDPRAWNHVLEALLFRALYHAGALNSTLYSSNNFLHAKPVNLDAATRQQIQQTTERVLKLCEQRLERDPNDVQALYARGIARGLHATYQGLVERAWFGALRSAIGARHDCERVLELQPSFTDAKTVLGVHNYVAGSLAWGVKAAISVVGLSGSKEKGLEYLRTVAAANVETTPDAKVALALFLRREQRYQEAFAHVRSLVATYPQNYLFGLEEANILKDWGHADDALAAYNKLVAEARAGRFHEPRLEFAEADIGDLLRARGQFQAAAEHYLSATNAPACAPDVKQRAALAAGEMYDALSRRDLALKQYEVAIASDSTSPLADVARKRLKEPYRVQ